MRIIEASDLETALPEEESVPEVKESKKEDKSPYLDILHLAKEIHELGNKLMELATKL